MATQGRRATAAGLGLTLISAGAGVSSTGGFALLLCFAGVLAGASLIAAGVRMADDPAPPMGDFCPGGVLAAASAGVRAVAHRLRHHRRNLALAGLLLASSATAAMDGETDPVLCFCAFALLLLGLSLVNIGVLLLGEQEQ